MGSNIKWMVLLVAFLATFSVKGQSYLQFQSSRGRMLIHTEALRDIQGIPNIYRLEYASVLKTKEYHRLLGNPLSGISLTYINHDHEATGKSFSISGFLQPSIISGSKHTLSGRISVGLSYVQNPFDEIENPLQQAIGSNLNFFAEGQLIYNYDLSEKMGLNFLAGMIHISNAARRLPNAGFNILTLGIGARYRLSEESHPPLPKFNSPEKEYELKAFNHYVYLRGGLKSIRSLDYNVYPAVGLNYTLAYRYHALGSITGGVDVDYNQGFVQEMKAIDDLTEDNLQFTRWRWAVAVGHELHMNKLSLVTQYAIYLRRPHPTFNYTYQRYGLKYYIGEKTVVAATLRAHAGRADYMEWTIGRRF